MTLSRTGEKVIADVRPARQIYTGLRLSTGRRSNYPGWGQIVVGPQEQDRIAKAGLEMKLASGEMEAEADRWGAGGRVGGGGCDGDGCSDGGGGGGGGEDDDAGTDEGAGGADERGGAAMANEDNDIVRRAKNMSGMALSMYEFTKGDGGSSLRTTQDLFTQAEYLAEEANRLYKLVRQFSYQVRPFLRPTRIPDVNRRFHKDFPIFFAKTTEDFIPSLHKTCPLEKPGYWSLRQWA